jgi:DNA-binding beta-propeller fold protein YncE
MPKVGEGDFRYELDASWPKIPEGWSLGLCSDVAVDSRDRVFVFNRARHPIVIFSQRGDFISSWGECEFKDPHGIFIAPDDSVWLTDTQFHVVTRHSPSGEMLQQLGDRGRCSPTVSNRGQNGKPFNMPSGVAISKSGDIFVSDGYGNRRVHRFSAKGELKLSWGAPGTGPGEFALLHNVGIDSQGRVFICDRENSRIQIFNQQGKFLAQWTDVLSPGDVYMSRDKLIYVAEQGSPTGVSIFTEKGDLVCRWRGARAGMEAPHGIWADSKGNVYVAEIGRPGHGQRCRKYARVR